MMIHSSPTRLPQRLCALLLILLLPFQGMVAHAAVALADQPVLSNTSVPGNMALALSVEYPTASRVAHTDDYASASTFLGYFDPEKCYLYQVNTGSNGVSTTDKGDLSYFFPVGKATNHQCAGAWSGNFLNWAATAAIDPFRWAMTGGRRVVDDGTTTIVEKGWHSGQGNLFPDRTVAVGEVAGATPYGTVSSLGVSVNGRGFKIRLTPAGSQARTFSASYYNFFLTPSFSGTPVTVPNDNANHLWGTGVPVTGINRDSFSARLDGTFVAPETGNYVFRSNSDDGVRVWVLPDTTSSYSSCAGNTGISGNCVINNWTDHGATLNDSGAIALTAGQQFRVRIEYYERAGDAVLQLLWKTPSSTDFTIFSDSSGTFDYTMRVKVCDPSAAAGGLESNCKQYGNTYKPEGLIQKYSNDLRYSAFSYLNDDNYYRDGGVLRARQKFVGPTSPRPGLAPEDNTAKEWSASTGILVPNPDGADATATSQDFGISITNSGVINYLNKFGQLMPGNYKTYDPVNELYYAALHYFRGLANVPEWTSMTGAQGADKTKWADGFPVITSWTDPIQYSCQRNFVLGIGDIYTHADKNVPGNTLTDGEPAMPAGVSSDTVFNAVKSTNNAKKLQGLGDNTATVYTGSTRSTDYMAGLAFEANTLDVRPDLPGKQTVQTYWVDVLEQPFSRNNKFYMAAKFGGLNQKKLPDNFDPYTYAATIPLDWWSTSGEKLTDTRDNSTWDRPDNYFTAGRPDTMVAGLTRAFESIVNNVRGYTTSFALSGRQVTAASGDTASYAAQYDASNWSGELTGFKVTFDDSGTPTPAVTPSWSTNTTFETQLSTNDAWSTKRRVVTWSGGKATPFRYDNLTDDQKSKLNTSYQSGDDGQTYLQWLRGDRSLEGKGYRTRTTTVGTSSSSTGTQTVPRRLGDIVGSKVTVVGPPNASYSDASNPGYSDFKKSKDVGTRPTMLYVGANDGMLHAFTAGLDPATAGQEQFAYVPSTLFNRDPADTAATTDGLLAQLGRPNYVHRNYVDATPQVFDVDLNFAGGSRLTVRNADGTTTADWHSLLIGGLGKGGRSYYAIDVTKPGLMTNEDTVAANVKWEFPAAADLPVAAGGTCPTSRSDCIDMGYTFGDPVVVKTAKYGWVVVFSSGYNNRDGKGYLFFVDPRNGKLLERVGTDAAADGMARPTAYVRDYSDFTADAIYVGDLAGQLWRFDVTETDTTKKYPAPSKLATFKDASNNAQPVTTQPLVEVHPVTRQRFVMVGTGRLLDRSDILSSQAQSFYALVDGGIATPGTVAGDTAAYPVDGRARLAQVAIAGASSTSAGTISSTVNMSGKAGWYIDLGVDSNVGWRSISPATAFSGLVGFSALLPTGDACSPGGKSRLYVLDYAKGTSSLDSSAAYFPTDGVTTDVNFYTVRGKPRVITGSSTGSVNAPTGTFWTFDPRQLGWRELSTVR